jgi:hypothetical protein
MATDETVRYSLHRKLDDLVGPDEAALLMTGVPPFPWAEVATKRDLDALGAALRREMRSEARGLRGEMREFRGEVLEKIGALEAKIGGVDGKIGALEAKIGGVEAKIGGVDGKIGAQTWGVGAARLRTRGEPGGGRGGGGAGGGGRRARRRRRRRRGQLLPAPPRRPRRSGAPRALVDRCVSAAIDRRGTGRDLGSLEVGQCADAEAAVRVRRPGHLLPASGVVTLPGVALAARRVARHQDPPRSGAAVGFAVVRRQSVDAHGVTGGELGG